MQPKIFHSRSKHYTCIKIGEKSGNAIVIRHSPAPTQNSISMFAEDLHSFKCEWVENATSSITQLSYMADLYLRFSNEIDNETRSILQSLLEDGS